MSTKNSSPMFWAMKEINICEGCHFQNFQNTCKFTFLKKENHLLFLHKNFHFLFVYLSNANSNWKIHETSHSVGVSYFGAAPLRPPCQLTKKIKNNRISNFLESWNNCHSQKMNFPNFSSFFDKGKTFRPKKKFQPGTLKYSLHKQAQASLNSGINLRTVSWSDLSEIFK